MYLINTKISSFHMLISHWDFLVFDLGVHVFPFLCCLSYSHWFYEFLDSFWIIPFISYKSCEKKSWWCLRFLFFQNVWWKEVLQWSWIHQSFPSWFKHFISCLRNPSSLYDYIDTISLGSFEALSWHICISVD